MNTTEYPKDLTEEEFLEADENWESPDVSNPYEYALYVLRLQKNAGFAPKFPRFVFMRFARMYKHFGYDSLCYSAWVAARFAEHPFSHKYILKIMGIGQGEDANCKKPIV